MIKLEDLLAKHIDPLISKKRSNRLGIDFGWADLIDSKYVSYWEYEPDANFEFILRRKKQIKSKLGRYLKLAYSELTAAEITHICEKVKALIDIDKGKFSIISGDQIKEAYFYKNYYPSHGTLQNSCMRYKKCQVEDFFQVYADKAEMLIMTPKRGKRILGRALIWKIDDKIYMDRVYTIEPYIEHQFYTHAKKQGWYVLTMNSYVSNGNIQMWLSPESNYTKSIQPEITIKLNKRYKRFPFMDSFRYYNDEANTISTYITKNCHYYLSQTNGRLYYRD